jgi:hypothetical protein
MILGLKGVDLYFRSGQECQFINTGRTQGLINEYTLIENMNEEMREFEIFLPLYDGVKNIVKNKIKKFILEELIVNLN